MLAPLLFILLCALVAYLLWVSTSTDPDRTDLDQDPPTEAELLQAHLDLHRVERGVDVALAKHAQRREVERVKQAIAEVLADEEDDRP